MSDERERLLNLIAENCDDQEQANLELWLEGKARKADALDIGVPLVARLLSAIESFGGWEYSAGGIPRYISATWVEVDSWIEALKEK